MNRRQFLAVSGAVALTGRTASAKVPGDMSPLDQGPSVGVELVAEGFQEPLDIQTADDDRLLYIAEKYGQILVQEEGALRSEPFLDIADQLAELTSWEQGLLGLELHPNFEENGKCYVRYSSSPRDGTPDGYSHTFVLSEFRADSDLRRVDPSTERTLLEVPEPGDDHNSGAIAFGPDGLLYVGVGEGDPNRWWSSGGDTGNADDWYWPNIGGNGQDVSENFHGSILRIDVDSRTDGKAYAVPEDNPLVGKPGFDEHYAWGFRNPYRMGFSGGELYVGDVGSASVEEINRVEKGGNYGWDVKEGSQCYSDQLFVEALAKLPWFEKTFPTCPSETPDGNPLIDPVIAYPHRRDGQAFGRSVVGGFVYEGETVSALQGEYLFADLMGRGSGLYAATPSGEGPWKMSSIGVDSGPDISSESILSLGRDAAGEIYVLTTQFAPETGAVYRIVPSTS